MSVKVSESGARPIQLMIVDDHAMFREGLARMFKTETDLRIVAQCATSSEALAALAETEIDIVLLDVDLGSERAMDFVTAAKRKGFEGRILIVTAGISDQEAVQLIRAGVAGILHKRHSTAVLSDTIRKIAAGEVWLEKAYLGPLFRSVDRSRPSGRVRLTDRDRTVLRFILQGFVQS